MTSFKFTQFIKKLYKFKFALSVPEKCDILILDNSGAETLSDFCGTRSHAVLDSERLNLPILLATFLRGHRSMDEYRNSYIRRCEPGIVITNIDNELYFFTIKRTFPKIITIAVQNGWRANYSPKLNGGFFTTLENLDSPSCDFYCVFNKNIGNYLSRFISLTPIVTGSVRNNNYLDRQIEKPRKTITFISQHPPRSVPDSVDGNFFGDAFVSDRVFYEVDLLVAAFLSRFCETNELRFVIGGKRTSDVEYESRFFSDATVHQNAVFRPRDSEYSTYDLVADSDIVVSIDSTTGYEALARGNRTAIFSIRGELISKHLGTKIDDLNFGWPLDLPDTGPFWTNISSDAEFSRILKYLMTVSDADWSNEIGKYTEDLMIFDPGNTVLRDLLERLGADLIN